MGVRLVTTCIAALTLVLALGAAAPAAAVPSASATAFVLSVSVPGAEPQVVGAATAPPAASGYVARFVLPDGGGVALVEAGWTSVRTGPGASPRAAAAASARSVELFGGEIVLGDVGVQAEASASRSAVAGNLSASQIGALTVLGVPVEPAANGRVELADWGYAVVLEQAVRREDGRGYRGFVAALHVYLTAAHGGLPAGSELVVGYAEAAARAPAPLPAPSTGPVVVDHGPLHEPGGPPPPGAHPAPPPIVLNPPPGVAPHLTGAGHAFPVWGPTSFSDDFGAPRATTGWHHGTDVFAPRGAPVLAAADGALFSVGWNPVGGYRLWLRDAQGNEYYYAHLSAYSPLATDGARVRAGDVIGFVGDTGDAQGTPPHLHFEVHPAALLGFGYDGAIDPYAYLAAWHDRRDASFSATVAAGAGGPAAEPGAVLLESQDISSVSGLDAAALRRALVLPVLLGEGAALVRPEPPALVGGPPGFS